MKPHRSLHRYHATVIDDGPFARLYIRRIVKRFDLDLSRWPRPPSRGGEWDTYWEFRVVEVLSSVGVLVRKLIEANKLSIEMIAKTFTLKLIPAMGDHFPSKINFPKVENFYDLENPRFVQVSVNDICNMLVHSFVLVPQFSYSPMNGLRFESFYVGSDWDRRKGRVYQIEWLWFVNQFVAAICRDRVNSSSVFNLPSGKSFYLPSRGGTPLHELVFLYCSISKKHRETYKEFQREWQATRSTGDLPTLDEAIAARAGSLPGSDQASD